jgi:hypothetical protein
MLFLLDLFTYFEIKNQFIRSLCILSLLVSIPFIFIWNLFILKPNKTKILGLILPTLIVIVISIIGPMKIIYSLTAWKTQTILYQNGHLRFNRIEYQMKDLGALGYNRRTIQVFLFDRFFHDN